MSKWLVEIVIDDEGLGKGAIDEVVEDCLGDVCIYPESIKATIIED